MFFINYFFFQLVQEILPDFKEKPVVAKDTLDIYIEHRLMMERRNQHPGELVNPKNKYAPELMRRLLVYHFFLFFCHLKFFKSFDQFIITVKYILKTLTMPNNCPSET